MTNNELSFWQNQVDEWQRSELSVAAYCRRHKIVYHKLLYWRSKLEDASQSTVPVKEASGFTRVVSQHVEVRESASVSRDLTVTLPNGIRVAGLHAGNISLLGDLLRQL